MEIILGIFTGISIFLIVQIIFNILEEKRNNRENEERLKRKEYYEKFEKEVSSKNPYKFSVMRDEQGWKWEVLRLYVSRGLNYDYRPFGVSGHTQTKEEAIEAGRKECHKYTEIKRWKEEREIYSLNS